MEKFTELFNELNVRTLGFSLSKYYQNHGMCPIEVCKLQSLRVLRVDAVNILAAQAVTFIDKKRHQEQLRAIQNNEV